MEGCVLVANVTNVLGIAFGVNVLFLAFEVKPLVDAKWRALDAQSEPLLSLSWEQGLMLGGPEGRRFMNQYLKLTGPRVLYIGLELYAFIFSTLSSLLSLGLLIALGYKPDLALPADGATVLWVVSFSTVPIYFLLSQALIRRTQNVIARAAKEKPDKR